LSNENSHKISREEVSVAVLNGNLFIENLIDLWKISFASKWVDLDSIQFNLDSI